MGLGRGGPIHDAITPGMVREVRADYTLCVPVLASFVLHSSLVPFNPFCLLDQVAVALGIELVKGGLELSLLRYVRNRKCSKKRRNYIPLLFLFYVPLFNHNLLSTRHFF